MYIFFTVKMVKYFSNSKIFFYLLLHFCHARVANLHVLLVTLLPGSVGLSLHLPWSPEPNSSCRSYKNHSPPTTTSTTKHLMI